MKRPERQSPPKREHLDVNAIQTAFDLANLEDLRNAEDIQKFSIKNGYRASDSIAAGIRLGYIRGKANGNRRAQEAHTRLHEYIGAQDKSAPPADRIIHAAGWIDSPSVLHELAAFLEGRAAALEAGTATIRELEPPEEPDIDVYSDGEMEV